MKTLELTIPAGLDFSEKETKRFLAAKLFESGRLSLGQAAEMVGLSKVAFAEILSDYDVSLANYLPSEIAEDAHKF